VRLTPHAASIPLDLPENFSKSIPVASLIAPALTSPTSAWTACRTGSGRPRKPTDLIRVAYAGPPCVEEARQQVGMVARQGVEDGLGD
jgi:hypothetical protein